MLYDMYVLLLITWIKTQIFFYLITLLINAKEIILIQILNEVYTIHILKLFLIDQLLL